ncbi:MAG: LysM peptidoglycan-binding domain-containing protein, partial [Bacillota bacterium]|nr:LysM peptidoglycan-binding domain-containing protein [Bacillota bacterium]
ELVRSQREELRIWEELLRALSEREREERIPAPELPLTRRRIAEALLEREEEILRQLEEMEPQADEPRLQRLLRRLMDLQRSQIRGLRDFLRELGALPVPPHRYIVQRGDTLFLIARRFGVSLEALIAANPQLPDPNRIFPGQVLIIPRPGEPPRPPAAPPGFVVYVVRRGDTMWSIARRFGLELQAVIDANPQVEDPNRIFPGQMLFLPLPAQGE